MGFKTPLWDVGALQRVLVHIFVYVVQILGYVHCEDMIIVNSIVAVQCSPVRYPNSFNSMFEFCSKLIQNRFMKIQFKRLFHLYNLL